MTSRTTVRFSGGGGGGSVGSVCELCAGFRELLPSAGNCSGIAGEPRITPEVVSVLAQFICREGLPPLVACLKQSAQQENPAELVQTISPKVPPDAEVRWQQLLSPKGESAHILLSGTGEPVMVCFSCGRSGHRVSRFSRMDTAFPFLPPRWSVDFRDGQYRAVWSKEPLGRFQSGNEN